MIRDRNTSTQSVSDEQKVSAWCRRNGYHSVNNPKRTLLGGTKYPLHTAVKQNDIEMVVLLVKCGAIKDVVDSQGRTPRDLALEFSEDFFPYEMILGDRNHIAEFPVLATCKSSDLDELSVSTEASDNVLERQIIEL